MAKPTLIPQKAGSAPSEIARLNGQLRATLTAPGRHRVMMTIGISALVGDVHLFRGFQKRAELLRAVRDYDRFEVGIDPYGEHDMGAFDFEDTACFWKIDYYNADLSAGSDDPADPSQTVRVITIMCADER